LLDFLRRAPRFDPNRGEWRGFVRGVVRNHAAVLSTRRFRRVRREVLFADLGVDPSESVQDFSEHAHHLARQLDIQRVLGRLPNNLRELAQLLTLLSVPEICVRTGRSRSRVYQMMRQLRNPFLAAGLGPNGQAFTPLSDRARDSRLTNSGHRRTRNWNRLSRSASPTDGSENE
jgi:hypothetical protein